MWRLWAYDADQRMWLYQDQLASLDDALLKVLKWKTEGQTVRLDFVHEKDNEAY